MTSVPTLNEAVVHSAVPTFLSFMAGGVETRAVKKARMDACQSTSKGESLSDPPRTAQQCSSTPLDWSITKARLLASYDILVTNLP